MNYLRSYIVQPDGKVMWFERYQVTDEVFFQAMKLSPLVESYTAEYAAVGIKVGVA